MSFPNRYNAHERGRYSVDFRGEESLTKQSFKNECDINRIMKRYLQTGILPTSPGKPKYGDFASVGDYQTAVETVDRAKRMFGNLPSSIRERFKNNPVELLGFMQNEKNLEEAEKLGLVAAAPRPAPAVPQPEPTKEK